MKWLYTLFERWRSLQAKEDAIWRESAGLPGTEAEDDSDAGCGAKQPAGSSSGGSARGAGTPDLASLVKQRQQESENRGDQ